MDSKLCTIHNICVPMVSMNTNLTEAQTMIEILSQSNTVKLYLSDSNYKFHHS